MRKKLFTFLLALATSVGMMHAAVDDSGSCGDNVTYSFNGTTGALVITGTGPMTEYSRKSDCPWDGYRTSITSVTVTDGVTTVSSNSFGQCTSLQSVTIGNDVETIGEFSFNDCGTNFTSLTLGSSVKSVGFAAFLFGKNIAELVLPESLETINDYAFCQLRAITTVTIPSKVTSIGVSAFYNCIALTSIYTEATTPPTLGDGVFGEVPTSIPLYVPNGSVAAYTAAAQWNAFNIQGYDPAPTPANVCGDGLTWELNNGELVISYDGEGTGEMYDFGYEYDDSPVNVAPWKENKSDITTVVIGDGVKSIGNYAFNDLGENFTAVTIANSVEHIGMNAFMNDKWVTEMTLPSSLKTIDKEGLANCGFATITIPSGVTSIGTRAFSYCMKLTSLTCEATTPPTLDLGVFSGIKSKQNIPLYVPSESVAAYQDAAQWNAFNVQAIPAPQPELAECGLVWKDVPEGGVVGTIGHEDEVQLPQLYATNPDFINALMGGTATVRLGSTDESVLAVYGFNNFAVNGVGECDVYAVHDEDAVFAYDSVAFHVTVNPEPTPAGNVVIWNMSMDAVNRVVDQNETKEVFGGITIVVGAWRGFMMNGNVNALLFSFNTKAQEGFTFANTLGVNFKKIVLSGAANTFDGKESTGWVINEDKSTITWEGDAASVSIWETLDFIGPVIVNEVEFTLEGSDPGPTPTVWTALKVGDVIKVGDKIEVPAEGDGSWGINGNVLRNAWGPYELIRADIYQASDMDDPVVTETEDGAFYVFKAENSNFYPLSNIAKGGGLVVTMTSDGLEVTAAENKEFTVAVHENGSVPTAVENVQTNEVQAIKLFRNGQLYIQREGVLYTVQGARVR